MAVSRQIETEIFISYDLVNLLLDPRCITQRHSHQVHMRTALQHCLREGSGGSGATPWRRGEAKGGGCPTENHAAVKATPRSQSNLVG